MQIFAIVVSLAIAAVGITLFVRAIREIIGVIRVGQPLSRTDQPGRRWATMLRETLGHTRMLQWTVVGIAHWFVFVGFGLLFFTLLTAFGQLFDPHFALPLVGHFFLWEWVTELFTVVMLVSIIGFLVYRLTRPQQRTRGTSGRLWGSTMWQGYFVEAVILGVGLCIMALRGLEYALLTHGGEHADNATALHFPFSFPIGEAFSGLSVGTIENLIYLVAMLKIVISFTWMIVISLNTEMGVAWHRFTVFFNIWFKREASGRTALGAMKPLTSGGKPVTLDDLEDLDEESGLGVGAAEDFAWKGILDFATCTECGRCQSQCPAWNTEKPLSPKLLITALRDHTYAKAPYLQAGSDEERSRLLEGSDTLTREVERPLVGDTGDDWFYMPDNGAAVIDSEVLWNCTSCGACVQQCPVDIEHVDHIMDMRRHQVLVEANFPAELNQLFKGLENKGNPWNMSASARMDWAKDLPFEVKVVGEDVESLDEVDWLFWVGCAGAYEDRAKKTTRAVAELLDMAGVSFGVLGNGETCSGDPARRAGNEFVFQGLASQNAETFKEYKVKNVVSTCAHCFNTLKNEYQAFGVELEVVHHTQLLNRLVREGRLTPIKDGAGAAQRTITYHDPCYLGRHNQVYSPPRDLLQVLPGAEYAEMERSSERSFCCGAGGARMWMEENTGERINLNRTKEAVGTGADQIAVGCPFCRVMLSDGLTAEQAAGNAREEVEVLDVAQMLLASVKGESATRARAGAGAAAPAAGGTGTATLERDEQIKDEPEAGDATQTDQTVTETADVGPLAKASGGTSLFDVGGGDSADEPSSPASQASPPSSGASLFDVGGDAAQAPAPSAAPPATPSAAPASTGSSLFDVPAQPEPAAPQAEAPQQPAPTSGGSLFDIPAQPEPAAPQAEAPQQPAPTSGGSLFDIPAPEPAAPRAAETDGRAEAEADAEPVAEPDTTDPVAATAAPAEPTRTRRGRSLFDIAAPAAPAAPAVASAEPTAEPTAEPPPEPTPEPASEPTGAAAAEEPEPARAVAGQRPQTSIPEGGSLFDIPAPEAAAPAAEPAPQPTPEAEPETSGAPTAEPSDALSGGAALSRAATFPPAGQVAEEGAGRAPDDDVDRTEQEPQQEPQPGPQDDTENGPEAKAEEESTPAGGPTHQPRTDVDISGSSSLFDL